MNYILNIVKSKAFVLVTSIAALTISCTVTAFAYNVHSIYALPDVSVDSTFLGTLKAESVVVLDVSPRSSPFSASVLIDYDSLADLVYRSNQHGFNVSLEYRGNINKYVAYADDYKLFNRRVFGCLGNIKGSVYVAEPPDSGGSGSDTPSTDYSGNLSSIYNVLREISNRIVNGFNVEYLHLSTINDNIVSFYTSVSSHLANASLDRQSIYSLLAVIDHKLDDLTNILDKMDSLSGDLTTLAGKIDALKAVLYGLGEQLDQIIADTGSSVVHLDHIEALQAKWLPAFGDNISTLVTKTNSIGTSVSNTLAEVMDVNTALTSIKNSASTAALKLDDIFYFLIDQNGPIYATPIIASKILAKLDDLHVTTDFTDTNIVGAINNLASLFSLGETQTIEAGGAYYFPASRGTAQSVSVTCPVDTGFVLFSQYATPILNPSCYNLNCVTAYQLSDYLSNFGFLRIDANVESIYGTVVFPGIGETRVDIVLLDSSGIPIPLKTGDLIRPTATVDRWAVVRTTGEAIEIADCTGLPYGLSFGDLFSPCALVPVRDLIAAPSLFTSYLDQLGYNQFDSSGCYVLNGTGASLTVEYVNPSSLLNWYANRQNDFRYWLDTRLSNLPVGQSPDVSALHVALTSLESTLSNPEYFAPVITSVDAVGVNIEDLNASFNTNIGSLLDKLDIVIEGTSESVENRINVTIDASNDAHNVFYITGEDGEEQSVTEFTGDLTKASGRLLSLLYRLVFADALSTVDGDLDGFEDFFTSQGEETATQDMNAPYEEENVWLAS